MQALHAHLLMDDTKAGSPKENCITVGATRVSVLMPQVLRIEHDKSMTFTDEPTQSIWYRDQGKVDFTHAQSGAHLTIQTQKAAFTVDTARGKLLYVEIDGKVIHPNARNNLKGTARTLDMTFGAIPLKDGVLSSDGVALLDDSRSLILENGMTAERKATGTDLYVFAFGTEYIAAVQALYALSGNAPLVPRFALGNWWSRYHAYTQEEYQELMLTFARKDIPLTVATIDMDWHWVDVTKHFPDAFDKKAHGFALIGSHQPGWTGYSWNTELFPDPKGFLAFLHKQGLKTTVNLHPALGFRCFEDCYADMAKAMGIDPAEKKTVEFDIADTRFINNYLDIGHHTHEQNGVDFWWIDWQQGTKSALAGLDPLWSLNHYHYLDSGRSEKRPLILSRYAGIGSHRYPLGFSGDTAMTWRVLRFQPYFTATAANCGYTWWSHDIGGHHSGVHDDELYTRWVQFGVFSPILRLHSTANALFGKEPWNYTRPTERLVTDALRLRHSLIPYIYSMNYRNYAEGRALCEPLYYTDPQAQDAYRCKNGYMFGSELLVCPVTSRCDKRTRHAKTKVYLPKGRWTNFFTGEIYIGGRTVTVHSDMDSIPVFAKSGAVIPMSLDAGNRTANPEQMLLRLYRGNGDFTLYEDDGETKAFETGDCSKTSIRLREQDDTLTLTLNGATANPYSPANRAFTLHFADVVSAREVQATANGAPVKADTTSSPEAGVTVTLAPLPIETALEIRLVGITARQNPPYPERIRRILTQYNAGNIRKSVTYMGLAHKKSREEAIAAAKRVTNRQLRAWLLEALCDME